MGIIGRLFLRSKMGRAYVSNDCKKAVNYALEYLDEKKSDEGALWLLVECYFRMGANDKAERYAVRLLSDRPDHLDTLKILSRIYYKKEEYASAYSCVSQALDGIELKSNTDQLLDDLSSTKLFSGLARNVRLALSIDSQEKNWTSWALSFRRWYEEHYLDGE